MTGRARPIGFLKPVLLMGLAGVACWGAFRPPGTTPQATRIPQPEAARLEQMGFDLLRQGRSGEAVSALLQAVAQDPARHSARFALAELYTRAGLDAPARTHLEAAVQSDPRNVAYWSALGSALTRERQYPDAAEAFSQAVALEPDAVTPRLNLADVQAEIKKNEEAEANYRQALQQEPGNPDARLRLIRFLIEKRSNPAAIAEARELLRPLESSLPNNPYIPFYRGRLALLGGDAKAAIADLKAVVARRPDVDVAWYALSRAYRMTGNATEADQAAAQSKRIRDAREETRIVEALAKRKPDDPALQLRLARLNAAQGRYAKALNGYECCLHLDPNNASARQEQEKLLARLQAEGMTPDMTAFNAMLSAIPNP